MSKNNKENINENINENKDLTKNASKKLVSMMNRNEYKNSIINSNDMVNVFTMFIVVAFLIQYLFNTPSNDGYSGEATAEIWSYGIMLLSLVCILIFNTILPIDPSETVPGIATVLPLILLLVAFFWAISIRLKYYKQINKKEVPKEYYSWAVVSNVMMTVEALLIVLIVKSGFNKVLNPSVLNNQINNAVNLTGSQESMKVALGNFILIFIIFVILGIQQVILDNFMLDG